MRRSRMGARRLPARRSSGYLRLLDSPDAASVLEPIALRTGELYQTTELTRDGALPQFSPDGSTSLYETGPIATRITRVVAVAEPARIVAELRGAGASFSPTARRSRYWKSQQWSLQPRLPPRQQPHRRRRHRQRGDTWPGRLALYEIATGRRRPRSTQESSRRAPSSSAPATPRSSRHASRRHGPSQIHVVGAGRPLAAMTTDADRQDHRRHQLDRHGAALHDACAGHRPWRQGEAARRRRWRRPGGGRGAGGPRRRPRSACCRFPTARSRRSTGSSPSFSPDGGTIVFVSRAADGDQPHDGRHS